MPRFTQADIIRAIRAFEQAGLVVGKVVIEPDGSIAVVAQGHDYERSQTEEDWRVGSPLYEPKPERDSKAFSVSSLADRWQCSEQTIRNMIKRGELRSFRYGSLIRIAADAVAGVEMVRRREGAQSVNNGERK
jgi:excisionase family DNA binding protein